MWSQVEPTMAIVCACLTTLPPLFAGLHNFLPSLSWTSRRTASSSSAKNNGRRSDLGIDPESDQKIEKRPMRWPSERRKSDMELSGFEQLANAGMQGGISFLEIAESERTEHSLQEDGASTTARAKSEESFV